MVVCVAHLPLLSGLSEKKVSKMYYDKQIETAKTPLELGRYLDLEMEEYSIGSGGVAINPNTLTLAVRSAIGICRDNPHLIFEDVPEDIVGLQNWCIKNQRVNDGKVSATGEIDAETSKQHDAEKPAETKQENKDAKREREGMIQLKPPEIFQKILWIKKYGRKHWKLVSLAILIVLCIWILSKINLFS